MSWLDRLARLPLAGSRGALREVTRKLERNRQEIEQLRARIAKQKRRLDDEKRRCERLERRLASVKVTKVTGTASRALTPHRQAFQAATPADRYRFATVVSYPKSGRT
jgi:chromosome segregation ATPase